MVPAPIRPHAYWWQIQRGTSWVMMDEWWNTQTMYGYQQYREAFWSRPQHETEKLIRRLTRFDTYDLDFRGKDFWLTNLTTGERCLIRRVCYHVDAPVNQIYVELD